jgi:hypothetical protein
MLSEPATYFVFVVVALSSTEASLASLSMHPQSQRQVARQKNDCRLGCRALEGRRGRVAEEHR